MTFTLSISAGALFVVGLSVALFVAVSVFCRWHRMFDEWSDPMNFMALFVLLAYAVLWAVPSLVAWAVWATWFR